MNHSRFAILTFRSSSAALAACVATLILPLRGVATAGPEAETTTLASRLTGDLSAGPVLSSSGEESSGGAPGGTGFGFGVRLTAGLRVTPRVAIVAEAFLSRRSADECLADAACMDSATLTQTALALMARYSLGQRWLLAGGVGSSWRDAQSDSADYGLYDGQSLNAIAAAAFNLTRIGKTELSLQARVARELGTEAPISSASLGLGIGL